MTESQPHGASTASRSGRSFLAAGAALFTLLVLVRIAPLKSLGNGYDLEAYRSWMAAIQDHGLGSVFDRTDTDYVGFHYLLWVMGQIFPRRAAELTIVDNQLRLLLKSPGLIGDLVSTAGVMTVAYVLARRRPGLLPGQLVRLAQRLGLTEAEAVAIGAGLLWGLNPALVYLSCYWGQNDSLVTAFALAALGAALTGHAATAAVMLIAGATLKPQPLIIAPVVAWAVFTRSGWIGAARAATAGALALLAGHLYFVATGHLDDLVRIYRTAAITPERLTFSAYNLWWPVEHVLNPSATDILLTAGPLTLYWGTLASTLVLTVLGVTVAGMVRNRDAATMLAAAGYLGFGFFMVGAGVHERYALPALAFFIPTMLVRRQWALPVLVLTATLTVNGLMTLPLARLYPQGQPTWLSLATAAVNIALLAWMTRLMLGTPMAATRRAASGIARA